MIWGWPRWCRSIRQASGPTSTLPARAPRSTQGAVSNYKDLPGEPADHALGRSRGGWTTKIHGLFDNLCAPAALQLTAGQANDNPQLAPLLAAYTAVYGRRFRLLADKAYSHQSTRLHLRQRRIAHTIPQRSDQIAHRKAQGSRGGRPPAFDARTYRHRNTAERGFNRLKNWRGVATRYDKYALTYLGGVILAAAILTHRIQLTDTP